MFEDFMQVLEAIGITLAIISPGLAAIVGYLRSKFKCIQTIKDDLEKLKDDLGDRQLRQSKALIILSSRMDDINKSQHPNENALNLGAEIETILKDKNGNL
jgi:AmiR/NasT family two-component response regulator